jgi:hypothetical protein
MTNSASIPIVLFSPGVRPVEISLAATHIDAGTIDQPILGADASPLPRGCAAELGHFSRSTLERPFDGRWTPLVGPRAPRPNQHIPLPRIGGGGEISGRFRWWRAFYVGIDELPAVGTLLAWRFYDGQDPTQARFHNTATHPSWWVRSARSPDPAHVEMAVDATAVWESGPAAAFRTVLPVREGFHLLFRGRHA